MSAWPFDDLEITARDLTLRLPTNQELYLLAENSYQNITEPGQGFLRDWIEMPKQEYVRNIIQFNWSQKANLKASSWNLNFAVLLGSEPIGMQEVCATEFQKLRTVDTGSWLLRPHQGQGYGFLMRAMVLELAFQAGADFAKTSAHLENKASNGVSLKLGYKPNGIHHLVNAGKRIEAQQYFLRRADFRHDFDIKIQGLEPCLPLLI